jgi:L-ascorbate 6-phosphate lactonase
MSTQFPWDAELPEDKAALWPIGQAGVVVKSGACTAVIDPYLSDSCGANNPLFSRLFPVPVDPSGLKADVFIITHDHRDHLDPDTIGPYAYKDSTAFVAPRFAARKLAALGVPEGRIHAVDQGESLGLPGVTITGVFALPTDPGALDTTGYLLTFANGRSVYHTSDTAYCDLLLKACPRAEVLLTCINGKYGNLNIAQAIELTKAVNPRTVIPNHYDVMALNSENPESFRYFLGTAHVPSDCVVLKAMERFIW